MNKEIKLNRVSINVGMDWKRFGIGFIIDRYAFALDLGPFWFGLEW
jgi:hypothetical protein